MQRRTFLQNVALSGIGLGATLYLPGCTSPGMVAAPSNGIYPPESQGVSSEGLLQFLEAADNSDLEFHSIMINRHGKTVLEAWWDPFQKDYLHNLYSLSKSFTSTAVGMLVDAGKLTVQDKVVSFFPDKLPAEVSEHLAAMRVHDLLTMHTGHDADTMGRIRVPDGDWVKAFLSLEVPLAPGSLFLYNTGATYMLAAIVQKVSGRKLIDFLQPRLFEPLNIEGADWEEDSMGINVGGYGLRVRTQDILNFGQLYLQKGKWGDQQLISEEWVAEATKKQVNSQDNDSDWGQGYGYQFWRCKPGCYRGDGAFGQYCIVVPEKDAVIAITSESKDMGASMQLVWDHILPAMQEQETLPEASQQHVALSQKAAALQLPMVSSSAESPWPEQLQGKTYRFADNDFQAETMSFYFNGDTCTIMVEEQGETVTVQSSKGQWKTGEQRKPAKALFAIPRRTPMPTKVSSFYYWKDENTLVVKLKYVENLHEDDWMITFSEDGLELAFDSSLWFEEDERPLLGAVME